MPRRLRSGLPIWLDTPLRPEARHSRLKGELEVDVVIIGGGITGAICAYLFASAGIRVAVLEAKLVERGSTAASTALLMQEPDRDFSDLSRIYGKRASRDIWGALARANRDLAQTIRALKIKADLCRCDSVYFTLDPRRVPRLRKEFEARKAAGLPGRWLSPAALLKMTGMHGAAGIATRGNALANPVRACRGFLRAAAQNGAVIFERSQARRVRIVEQGVEVVTAAGQVRARCVVVATGYATREFRSLVGRFAMKDTYVVVTRRLPPRLRRRLLQSRVMAWDTTRPYHYLRWSGSRLLLGGEDTVHKTSSDAGARLARAKTRLLEFLGEIYPALAGERPDYAWQGLFAETPDGMPYVGAHARYPKHLFALGYGGNGMTASFLAGRILLDLYRGTGGGQARDVADLFAFRRRRG